VKLAFIALAAMFSLVIMITVAPSVSRKTHACGIGVEPFESLLARAEVIVLADVIDTGGGVNPLPTLTPLATFTPTATPTSGSPTPTRDPGMAAQASPTSQPTNTPVSLVGYSATANVVRAYKGGHFVTLRIDVAARAGIELALRQEEQRLNRGVSSPCPPGAGIYRYVPGGRYVILGTGSGAGIETIYYGRFRVIGDEVILQDETLPYEDWGYLVVGAANYGTYFAGIEAERFDGETQYHIRADRIPFDAFERIITGAPPIAPPKTGSAGLKPAVR
jgi:hypothetical protein